MSSWTGEVVDALCESKRCGLDFEAAWELAIRRHPPRLHELGVGRAREDAQERLWDQSGWRELEWWRGVCEAAYVDAPAADGSPSRLCGLRSALEIELRDRVPVGRPSRQRPVAA